MTTGHAPFEPKAPAVLAVDVGGSHVKMLVNGERERRRFVSGRRLTAEQMVDGRARAHPRLEHEVVSVGVPAPVLAGRVLHEPVNLGKGWVGFDFASAFGKPTKVVNDAAMQALGSYEGGRMLFLGLGTGLGSTMIVDGIVEPMELGHLPFRKATFEDYVGERGTARLGDEALAQGRARHDRRARRRVGARVRRARRRQRRGRRDAPGACDSARTRTPSSAASVSGPTPEGAVSEGETALDAGVREPASPAARKPEHDICHASRSRYDRRGSVPTAAPPACTARTCEAASAFGVCEQIVGSRLLRRPPAS